MQSQAEHTSTRFPELFVRIVFQQEDNTKHDQKEWVLDAGMCPVLGVSAGSLSLRG